MNMALAPNTLYSAVLHSTVVSPLNLLISNSAQVLQNKLHVLLKVHVPLLTVATVFVGLETYEVSSNVGVHS